MASHQQTNRRSKARGSRRASKRDVYREAIVVAPPAAIPRRRAVVWIAGVSIVIAAAVLAWLHFHYERSPTSVKSGTTPHKLANVATVSTRPEVARDAAVFSTYAGSGTCVECHRNEHERWATSHHGLAERIVQPNLDKAAFNPARTFHHGSQTSDVRIDGEPYQIVTLDLTGKKEPQTVRRVIGVDPLRQFLVDAGHGRMQTLEAAYDPIHNEWFDVYGNEDRRPGEWGHWTGRGMTWNSMCAACHNTRLRKNYDEAGDSYHTAMAEISVSCEACHGPMKSHVQWQQTYKKSGPAEKSGTSRKDPTLLHPSRDQIFDNCGSCHSRRGELSGDFVPGQAYFDHYALEGVDETDLFYPDGQVHDEDYEFSAFLGSKMHAAGVRCADCHDPHSGKTLLEGNALCMKCHAGGPAYPKAPIINLATHSFHKFDSAGSQCVNCHMPQTTYMQRHARHDHGFTVPDPLLTKQIGVPNACNRCHTDKDTNWAVTAADKWYGKKLERPSRKRAMTIAQARKGDGSANPALMSLLQDPTQSFYWKAAVVRLLGTSISSPEVLAALIQQCRADHPMVREAAITALGPLVNHPDVAPALRGMLKDASRNVRIAAANALARRLDPDHPAMQELFACFDLGADGSMGQLRAANFEAARNNEKASLAHLEKALAWDPSSPPVHANAATLYSQFHQPQAALAQQREAVRLDPNNAHFRLLLGMAAAEAGDPAEALAAMERSVQLDPRYARAWYNLAMARASSGKPDAALDAFNKAEALDPTDPDIPFELAKHLRDLRRPADAIAAAKRALRIRPDYAPAAELIRELSGGE